MNPKKFYKQYGDTGVDDVKGKHRVIRECNKRVIVRFKKKDKEEKNEG